MALMRAAPKSRGCVEERAEGTILSASPGFSGTVVSTAVIVALLVVGVLALAVLALGTTPALAASGTAITAAENGSIVAAEEAAPDPSEGTVVPPDGSPDDPDPVDVPAPALGSIETFWALDWGSSTYEQIDGAVRFVGDHCVIYVHTGALIPVSIVDSLGAAFDAVVYPAVTEAYGPEPNPGIDGDRRIAILIYDFDKSTIDGSFNPHDIEPNGTYISNQREMFYLNQQAISYEPQNAGALAAHEFAHLILHYRDVMLDPSPDAVPEAEWLTEGFTTYAEHLSGYDLRVESQLHSFTSDLDTSLTRWQGYRANYGASYAFMRYLRGRVGLGPDFIRALVEQPLDGVAGISATLNAFDSFQTFNTLFDDWVLANFLDSRPPQMLPYAYDGLAVCAAPVEVSGRAPLLGTRTVQDFGAAYLDFFDTSRDALFQVVVDGADTAPLQAALISWDSDGILYPSIQRFDFGNPAAGDTVTSPPGYDRHTLAVWARGKVGSPDSYQFRYSATPDPPAGVQFLDMGGDDHFYEYAALLLERGIISGRETPAGSGLWSFAGREDVTRAQFAKMVMEATGLHTPGVENLDDPTFEDVRPTYDQGGQPQVYPFDYIEEAAALGIVNGYADGLFRPYRPITRSQLVLMIVRGAMAAEKPLPLYGGNEQVFVDVITSNPRYREIMTAYTAGILSGSVGFDGRLYFYPDAPASRNHVAKMTANLVGCLEACTPPEAVEPLDSETLTDMMVSADS